MISFNGVSKYYGNKKVLDDINFLIKGGEIFGVIGQSGAGKSTLVRTINQLTKIDNGEIKIDNLVINDLSKEELNEARRIIGFIFQDFNLLNSLTVYENVALSLQYSNLSEANKRKKVKAMLNLVELSEHIDKYPKQLSGGQKQRVGIARALVLEPSVLLCDELTSALDPKTSKQISELLIKINKRIGVTIVVITHEMDFVIKTCDRALILDDGKVVELETIGNLLLNAKSKQAKLLVDGINKFDCISQELPTFYAEHKDSKIFEIKYANSKQSLISDLVSKANCKFNLLGGNINHTKDGLYGVLYIQIYTNIAKAEAYFLAEKTINRELR